MFGSYSDAGMFVAVGLINELAVAGRTDDDAFASIADLLEFDPPTRQRLRRCHVPGFVALGHDLQRLFEWLDQDDIDRAAAQLNRWLTEFPATPHLAQYGGVWQLHHHPATVDLVPMYTSICAEIIARLIGTGNARRLGLCTDPTCRRAYVDQSRNVSRRYCSLACQNRAKTAAHRARQRQPAARA
jgi:hypothetical protein